MRNAETILGIIRLRGERRLPLKDAYRQLFNPDLYLRGYGRLYRNAGAMTPGVTEEAVDAMSEKKIAAIVDQRRHERYRWSPARRTYIPKANGKMRPLGMPTWSDKLVQEVMRSVLEAYYEPRFSDLSHGFRPDRGCHTALRHVQRNWTGTKWFIEGDIKGYFDNIDHTVLLAILREDIHDNRFLILVENMLKAGYLEEWGFRPTRSGTPQGGVISPILANIYLHKFDEYIETQLIPSHTSGALRRKTPEYHALSAKASRLARKGKLEQANALRAACKRYPPCDQMDPDYRRIRYVRYADDFILGFVGPKEDAETIKDRIQEFLRDHLKLELSDEKTLITNAKAETARFLGYEIGVMHSHSRPSVNGRVARRLPADVLAKARRRYYQGGQVVHRNELLKDSDFDIVTRYGQEYRGFTQYYALASNLYWCRSLRWTMRTSLLKTLANKHRSSVARMSKAYSSQTVDRNGTTYQCIEVVITREGKPPLVARFAGLPLGRNWTATLQDDRLDRLTSTSRTELIQRLLAEECELCGSRENVEVHHIRKLADLQTPGKRPLPLYKRMMSARRRKTLVLCRKCHKALHNGQLEGRVQQMA